MLLVSLSSACTDISKWDKEDYGVNKCVELSNVGGVPLLRCPSDYTQ